jgi:RHS repeat-associated protein
LGGQVVAEITWTGFIWQWNRGYVYLGSQLLAVQQAGVNWMHEDPVTKSKRVTNSSGAIVSTIELDPWGADTNRSSNAAFQPKKFTSYERDGNGSDEAMFRRYNRWHSRFDQPDPYDGSYSLGNPQSFNRYAYVNGDPVNFVDPSGLIAGPGSCGYYDAESGTFHFAPCPVTCSRYEACYGGSNDDGFGGNPSRGGGGGQQDPAPTPQKSSPGRDEKEINDCKTLADMAQTIADLSPNHGVFLDTMARTFTAARFAGYREMIDSQNRASRMTFGDSGFKSEFQDGSNQVRHFVAGFIAGALDPTGGLLALSRMNDREDPRRNPIDQKDVNLNRVSTQFGATYGGAGGMDFTRRYLARAIRKVLCE